MNTYWRRVFSRLAGSDRIKTMAQSAGLGRALAHRYCGGADAQAAADAALALRRQGIACSLFHLGEYVRSPLEVEGNVQAKRAAVAALAAAGLDVHVSVDPTQLGLLQSPAVLSHNLKRIGADLAAAATGPGRHALMLDMEDAGVTDVTLAAHAELRAAGMPAAVTLQAYRHRTADDLSGLVRTGAMVRLVKGAFPAGPGLALQRRQDVTAAYLAHARTLLSPEARRAGVYPAFATHDTGLQQAIVAMAEHTGWHRDAYEFEMLLGARDEVARSLAQDGRRVRLYVPFGADWWPYAMRRVGENPATLRVLLRGGRRHG